MEGTGTILGAILEVFNEVATWLVSALNTLMGVFYNAETGLTVMGVLGVSSLAIAVIFLNQIGRNSSDTIVVPL